MKADTKNALKILVKKEVEKLTLKDAKTANKNLVKMEKDAWTVQNAKEPYFLEQTMKEVENAYKNKVIYTINP